MIVKSDSDMEAMSTLDEIEKRLFTIGEVTKHIDVWSAYSHDVGYLLSRVKRITESIEGIIEDTKVLRTDVINGREVSLVCEILKKALEE